MKFVAATATHELGHLCGLKHGSCTSGLTNYFMCSTKTLRVAEYWTRESKKVFENQNFNAQLNKADYIYSVQYIQ